MNLVDTHSHIYLKEFDTELDKILARAENEGIVKILMPAIDSSTHADMLGSEAGHHGLCQAMMGLHPCSVKNNYEEEVKVVEKHLGERKFVAIGETGLDFYWDKTYTDLQYKSFQRQIDWARQLNVPIVIHSRNSLDECIELIEKNQDGKLKGVFHCFSGSVIQAKKITGAGFYLGIGGVLTFKNSGLDEVMKEISLEHVVLETDAPYLAPVPYRGKRNEPAYLKFVVDKLSGLKFLPVEEIAAITTSNAEKLFGL